MLSTKKYNIAKGLPGSPSAGLEHHAELARSAVFPRMLINTATLSILSILFTCILALLLILCISSMPNRIIKNAAIIIISIPAFLPITAYAGIFIRALSSSGLMNSIITSLGMEPVLFLADKTLFSVIFAVMDALRNVFIPVIIGVLVCEREGFKFDSTLLVLLIYALVRATLFMSPDMETLLLTTNPLVYESTDVFDTVAYRTGLVQMQLSKSGAMWVIKSIAQLLINVVVFFILNGLFPKLKGMASTLSNRENKGTGSILSVLGFILCAVGSIGIAFAAFFPFTKKLSGGSSTFEGIRILLSNGMFQQAFFNSLILCIIGSILYAFITLSLALPMTAGTKIYPLLLVMVMSLSNNVTGEFIFYKTLGMSGTMFPVFLSTITVFGAFALHFTVSGRLGDEIPSLTDYLKASLLPLSALVVLFFITSWGGFLQQLIHITNRRYFPLGMFGMDLLTGQASAAMNPGNANNPAEAIKAAFILLSSIVPVALGSLLIALNRFIPLSVFSAQARKN